MAHAKGRAKRGLKRNIKPIKKTMKNQNVGSKTPKIDKPLKGKCAGLKNVAKLECYNYGKKDCSTRGSGALTSNFTYTLHKLCKTTLSMHEVNSYSITEVILLTQNIF